MQTRTTQDLLAERRANVLESMRETDTVAKATLLAHVDTIDAELSGRRHWDAAFAKMDADQTAGY